MYHSFSPSSIGNHVFYALTKHVGPLRIEFHIKSTAKHRFFGMQAWELNHRAKKEVDVLVWLFTSSLTSCGQLFEYAWHERGSIRRLCHKEASSRSSIMLGPATDVHVTDVMINTTYLHIVVFQVYFLWKQYSQMARLRFKSTMQVFQWWINVDLVSRFPNQFRDVPLVHSTAAPCQGSQDLRDLLVTW